MVGFLAFVGLQHKLAFVGLQPTNYQPIKTTPTNTKVLKIRLIANTSINNYSYFIVN
jgi:hypothetical protein